MDAPIIRPTNLDKCPMAGRYRYQDTPDTEPVEVEVWFVHGACLVRFLDDEGTEMHFSDLPHSENWQEHFARTR